MGSVQPAGQLGMRVIEEIAAIKGVDPSQLDKPLYDVIDPGSLNSLFNDGEGKVSFR